MLLEPSEYSSKYEKYNCVQLYVYSYSRETHAMQMSQPLRICLKQRLTSMVVCVTCKKEVTDKDKAMVCDLCDKWEHVGCLKHNDKLSDKLYEALVGCCSKAVLYVYSPCRKKGMIVS